jgi:hypothetical protein
VKARPPRQRVEYRHRSMTMARVYSLHMLAIKAGCTGEQFEGYWREIRDGMAELPGVTFHLLKGDRGDRTGRYALMIEMESEERRAQLFPTPGPGASDWTPEVQQWMAANGPRLARWSDYATMFDVIYTDYVDVSA